MEIDLDIDVAVAELAEADVYKIICDVCVEIAKRENLAESYLSVSLVDGTRIQELNRLYRGLDAETDVLSFALLEADEPEVLPDDEEEELQCLGDLVISWPHVVKQAQDYGHAIKRELAFLTAHGMLHLLGYDHADVVQEADMFAKQDDILNALGFAR